MSASSAIAGRKPTRANIALPVSGRKMSVEIRCRRGCCAPKEAFINFLSVPYTLAAPYVVKDKDCSAIEIVWLDAENTREKTEGRGAPRATRFGIDDLRQPSEAGSQPIQGPR